MLATWRFHSFVEGKDEVQPAKANVHGNMGLEGLQRRLVRLWMAGRGVLGTRESGVYVAFVTLLALVLLLVIDLASRFLMHRATFELAS